MNDDFDNFNDVDDVSFSDDIDLFSDELSIPDDEQNKSENTLEEMSKVSDDSRTVSGESTDLCSDISTSFIPEKLDEIELQIDRLKQRWGECTYLIGQRLKYISEKRLYQGKGYNNFKTYVAIAIKMSENNAYYYISVFEYFTEEQTRMAGSKLKLLIPLLNKVSRDTSIPEDERQRRVKDLRDELFGKIYNRSYRDAEKVIREMRDRYFTPVETITTFERCRESGDRVIIFESDPDIRQQLLKLVRDFYGE